MLIRFYMLSAVRLYQTRLRISKQGLNTHVPERKEITYTYMVSFD